MRVLVFCTNFSETSLTLRRIERAMIKMRSCLHVKYHYSCPILTLSDPMSDLVRHYDFPVPDAFPHVVRTLTNI
jgi:hypothetical protein